MVQVFELDRRYAQAYPFHPSFFKELDEALTRTAYFQTFAPTLPTTIRPNFFRHASTAPVRGLRLDVVNHLARGPKVGYL